MTTPTKVEPEAVDSIHPETRLGPVELNVAHLESQLAFYRQALGMTLNWKQKNRAGLGTEGIDLLILNEAPGFRRYTRVTGLYHFALLYPGRTELARAIARLIELRHPNYPTDHIMTKSTYLDDPEGNGIELYAESPEDGSWNMANGSFGAIRSDGSWSDGREALDLQALFQHLKPGEPLDAPIHPATRMGHVHLHVRDLDEALAFYHGVLGFGVMGTARQVGAAFVSAGNYHHHIGLNTWQGENAPPPPADALGLRYFTILLPDPPALNQLSDRLQSHRVDMQADEGGLLLHDPSMNGIRLMSPPSLK